MAEMRPAMPNAAKVVKGKKGTSKSKGKKPKGC